MFNVIDYGIIADGITDNRKAIQAAVDDCSNSGGGIVYFPAGKYVSSSVFLRSNVTIHLSPGAIILVSNIKQHYDDIKEEYNNNNLFIADGVEHVSIIGAGTIHGQAETDWGHFWNKSPKPFGAGVMIIRNCKDVRIKDISINYSGFWTIHLCRSERIFIDEINISNNIRRIGSDGIDVNSCRDVHISNCHIVSGDDCIVLKSNNNIPCENVVVNNCTMETTCTALKIGTETLGDFRNIHFMNCTICNTSVGIGFYNMDGAIMERITFSGITIKSLDIDYKMHPVYPIFMDIQKRHNDSCIGTIKDVIFRDIFIKSGSSILMQGMPESLIENITMQNITFRVKNTVDFDERHKVVAGRRTYYDERDTLYSKLPSYMIFANMNGIMLDNIKVFISKEAATQFKRSAIAAFEVKNAVFRNIHQYPDIEIYEVPLMNLHNCSYDCSEVNKVKGDI